MDLRFTAEEEAFRGEVREFIRANLDPRGFHPGLCQGHVPDRAKDIADGCGHDDCERSHFTSPSMVLLWGQYAAVALAGLMKFLWPGPPYNPAASREP